MKKLTMAGGGMALRLLQVGVRGVDTTVRMAMAVLFGKAGYAGQELTAKAHKPLGRVQGADVAHDEPMAPPQACDRVHVEDVMGSANQRIGVIWLYLFAREGRAKRLFKLMDPRLSHRLLQPKQGRYFMSDMAYDPRVGIEPLMQATRIEVQHLMGEPMRTLPAPHIAPHPAAASPKKVVEPLRLTYDCRPERPVQPEVPSVARRVRGEVFEGAISVARRVHRQGSSGPYQSFCLTIHDGERETPLYGAELERSALDLGLHPGERVRVVYMGKQSLEVPGAEHRVYKNLYQVSRVAG